MPLQPGARVLLIRLSAMGDVLFALETLASLKAERPDVLVDFLVEDRFAPLLAGHPQLERVLVFPRRTKARLWAAVRALRRERYDVVLDLHGNLKSAVHARLARARLRLGYAAPIAREGAAHLYQRALPLTPRPHRAEQGLVLLRALGLSGAPARPVLPGVPEARLGALAGRTLEVVLHPGTSAWAAFKRWPLPCFAELARRLAERGLAVAVSHGPGEESLARDLRASVKGLTAIDGGALGLQGLAAVLGKARVVVAADTGPLHLAAAAGARVVGLFGPKDPALYGPRGPGHRVLHHDVPCRPCRRRACASPQCMLGLPVDAVEAAVLEVLSLTPA